MKGKYQIFSLLQKPGLKQEGALWFHEKWNIPEEAYLESMEESLREHGPVPQWYLALDEEQIIGGLGIIENDFHNRKDLSPNVCAVYVEEAWRCQGIAGALLERACRDMARRGDQHTIFADGPYLLL